jgi:AraC-like DNA-binding protein
MAQDLLSTTPLPVKEVAAEVGYRYVGNFVRDFHKVYGLTPCAFRAESEDARGEDPREDPQPARLSDAPAPGQLAPEGVDDRNC